MGRGKDESGQPGSGVQGTGQGCTSSEGTPYPLRALQIYHDDCTASDRKASWGKDIFFQLGKGAVWAAGSLEDCKGSIISHTSRTLSCVMKALGHF